MYGENIIIMMHFRQEYRHFVKTLLNSNDKLVNVLVFIVYLHKNSMSKSWK